MAQEQVTSPDQRKPTNYKAWYAGWIAVAVLLLTMLFGNHRGNVENIWLVCMAAVIVAGVLADWTARKRGLK